MTAREDFDALQNQAIKDKATTGTDELPANLSPTSKFSFLESFAVIAHPNGGFVIQQIKKGEPAYSRAFTGLDDLSGFLIRQKAAFEFLEDYS